MAARRRSSRVHDRILDAAGTLFAELGILATSMDAIAAEAGVSKATLYSHWADKDALFLEALGRLFGLDEAAPVVDTGDLRADLAALLRYRPAGHRIARQRRVMPHLMAYASQNRAFGATWRARVMLPSRLRLQPLLMRAIERGRLPGRLHLEAAIAMLIGPIVFRELFSASYPGLPDDLPERVADTFCRAHEIPPEPPVAKPPASRPGAHARHPSSSPGPRATRTPRIARTPRSPRTPRT